MDDIVKDFLIESYENLDRLDRDFVALETDPTAIDKLGSIFRTIHTIKGTCGCLGLSKLESVAHVGENLLSRLRDGQLLMDKDITTALLRLVDAIREMLGFIESTGSEGDADYSAVRAELVELNERPTIEKGEPSAPTPEPAPAAEHHEVETIFSPEPPAGVLEPAVVEEPHAPAADHVPEPTKANKGAEEKAGGGDSLASNAIRVDVGLLDKLMNLVGELVLTRNQVLQFTGSQKDSALLRPAQRLNLITTELQEGVMKTRMQPIGNLWGKFPRIVRDVATACGKQVRIEMEGRETELDRTIIEAIKDPLTHVIRNSVDHGVESPEKRRAAGKPEEGLLFMRAFHEGGQVNIEITDDGAGINAERVKRKAVEKGIITADHAARMSERDAINLIFAPGFSTAEKITNVSGRGVGMDVVKTNVEKIGGTVDVNTTLGHGTTLRIKIPLTLAIIPALVITSGGDRFCIPQVSLLELVRMDPSTSKIEIIHGTPVYRLRGNLLPLIYLNRELKLTASTGNEPTGPTNIVVLRGGERQFGLVVDQINDTEEIVVKPLAQQLKGISVLAGATIMGDGKVALILDVTGLAQAANMAARADAAGAGLTTNDRAKADVAGRQPLLLFNAAGGQRMAIPLSTVARLEEFDRGTIEQTRGRPVVQYRGQIMPLIDVGAGATDDATRAMLPTIVFSHGGRNVGLLVDQILDVVDEHVEPQRTGGSAQTAIIKERVTELLDVASIVRDALGDWTACAA